MFTETNKSILDLNNAITNTPTLHTEREPLHDKNHCVLHNNYYKINGKPFLGIVTCTLLGKKNLCKHKLIMFTLMFYSIEC